MASRESHEKRLGRAFSGPEGEVFEAVLRTADLLLGDLAGLAQEHGLSASQYDALRVLRTVGRDGLPCGELGSRMWTRAPDVTRLLDRLEGQGLVERERGEADRRVVVARLTAMGEQVLQEVDEPVARLHREQLGHLSPATLKQLTHLLERAQEGGPADLDS